MIITSEIFLNYIVCKYKVYCKLKGKEEIKSDYEILQVELGNGYRDKAIKSNIEFNPANKTINFYGFNDLKLGNKLIVNTQLGNDSYSSNLLVLEKISGKSKLGNFYYSPIFFCKDNKISKRDKLCFAFDSFVLEQIQGRILGKVKVVFGEYFKVEIINVDPYLNQVKGKVNEIKNLAILDKDPKFSIFDYCRSCLFCKSYAIEKDDLSLLRGMSAKDIQKWNNKGVFTVTQLSYTFRPRKRSKRMIHYKRKHLFELKALAIREKKIFVYEKPEIQSTLVHIFLDIEGNENNSFHYLIGLVVRENELEKQYSFWADSPTEEKLIINQFLSVVQAYENYTLFHYGSYERRYLQSIKKKFPKTYDEKIDTILEHAINVLSIIYSSIYFPTFSNELKDIGNYVGFKWTEENASGIQSLVWRTRWELIHTDELKQKLITYNLEDCIALKQITDFIQKISNKDTLSNTSGENSELMWTQDFQSETSYKWGYARFFFPSYDVINKCAYFDYQREKIFIRSSSNLKKIISRQANKRKKIIKINKVVVIRKANHCPHCGSKKIYFRSERREQKIVYDLKFFQGGVKKWVVKYIARRFICSSCRKDSAPQKYRELSKYGHNLASWVVYQMIENGTSIKRIQQNLFDVFGFSLENISVFLFKNYAACYYASTYKSLLRAIIRGKMIHCDETQVKLRTNQGYVWVLTNMESVIFLYKDSREGEFLKELLKDFKGVLISDFFAAYDSLNCPQQKCLIHLIRDLNSDLFKNPFDEELKKMVELFGILLKKIIDTIDTFGLKNRHLNKHKRDTYAFYKFLRKQKYSSELAIKYKKRFEKNKDKLFTFLDYDDVTWNNNNAEHAFKHFATYRRIVDGMIFKSGLEDYLVLLSIYQTCRYRDINFLKFLLSGKKDIDIYKA